MAKITSHKALSFDVYGTLIDWESGIVTALSQGYQDLNPSKADILHAFHNLEKKYQSLYPDLPYSQLLSKLHPALASQLNLSPPSESTSQQFGDSVGLWPAFPDTLAALKRLHKHFKLAVLSNTDRASFAATNNTQLPGVEFDAVLTAQDIGSYKPDRRNFEYLLEYVNRTWGISKDEVLQTAQSQFHDHYPAKEIGIHSAWIVRPGAIMGEQGKKGEEIWDWRFDTLGEMADAVEKEAGRM
ncbi:MAG: hypothetical protein L6R38_006773 [Xanthoria sp. 2 TBL-2021]|nr:MAG: hypothetical protein L6R38_006773 [Xanthoria sp. 2 TBL-2021]